MLKATFGGQKTGGRYRGSVAIALLLLIVLVADLSATDANETAESGAANIAVLTINGAIGPATTDYFIRSMQTARDMGAVAIIVKMDTPGGLDAATRDLVKNILAADIPVITFVHPAGGRAASAGTYILYASHIAAMAPATTLGAATPVSIAPSLPTKPDIDNRPDEDSGGPKSPGTAMERKVTNDAVAFIRSLARRHGRNGEWAEKAVRQAATLTASEALQQKVIDIVARDIDELLVKIHQREVKMEKGTHTINSTGLAVVYYDPDWRNKILSVITNPQIAYILLMIGIYGLVLEGYNPGALVPGVIGGICLITAFYALQLLSVNYAGLALIILGVLLIIAETLAPSFGILGIGGVIALTLGSIMLIDSDVPGMEISYSLVAGFAVGSSIVVMVILFATGKSLRMQRVPVEKSMTGATGTIETFKSGKGFAHVRGELWQVTSDYPLGKGQKVQIISQRGLLLTAEPIEENKNV